MPKTERTRHVDGQQRGAVARQLGGGNRAFAPVDPGVLELAEQVRFAHRGAEDHGRAGSSRSFEGQSGMFDRHARGGEREL